MAEYMDVREKQSSEKRLIDANKLIDFIDVGHLRHPGELCYSEVDVANILLHAPTVDAVPVVRCRECVHWKPTGSKAGNSFSDMEYIGSCEFTKYCRRESDFCSYGERKGR